MRNVRVRLEIEKDWCQYSTRRTHTLQSTHSHPREECSTRRQETHTASTSPGEDHHADTEPATVADTTFMVTPPLHATLAIQKHTKKALGLLYAHPDLFQKTFPLHSHEAGVDSDRGTVIQSMAS